MTYTDHLGEHYAECRKIFRLKSENINSRILLNINVQMQKQPNIS